MKNKIINKRLKKPIYIILTLIVCCLLLGLYCIVELNLLDGLLTNTDFNIDNIYDVDIPWDEEGAKQPMDYTRDEYLALNPVQKDKFLNSFDSEESLSKWEETAGIKIERYPWFDIDAKKPDFYTLEEYEALTEQQKIGFKLYFGSQENFDAWLNSAKEYDKLPSWQQGGKQPKEYTFEEYYALSEKHQLIFQSSFGNVDLFTEWFDTAKTIYSKKLPWNNGGKLPEAYTFADYNKLTSLQQMMFQEWFGNIDSFMTWYDKVQPNSNVTNKLPWENGGKLPNKYTLAEFNALSGAEQIAFQRWFNSSADFDAWLASVQNNSTNSQKLPWENGGKLPNKYTLAEFNALSGAEQIAFQNWFESPELFEDWLNSVSPNEQLIN